MNKLIYLLVSLFGLQGIHAELSYDESLKKLIEGNKQILSEKTFRPNQTSEKVKCGDVKIIGAVIELDTSNEKLVPDNHLNKIAKERK